MALCWCSGWEPHLGTMLTAITTWQPCECPALDIQASPVMPSGHSGPSCHIYDCNYMRDPEQEPPHPAHSSQRTRRKKSQGFKPLGFGVVCYIAIDKWNSFSGKRLDFQVSVDQWGFGVSLLTACRVLHTCVSQLICERQIIIILHFSSDFCEN